MKDILVLSDGGPHDEVRLGHAEELANGFGAQLTVFMMNAQNLSTPVMSPALGTGIAVGMVVPNAADPKRAVVWDDRQAAMESRFSERKGAVRLLRLDETAGGLAEAALHLARTVDLTVCLLPPDRTIAGGMFDRILIESGHAVLGIPESLQGSLKFERVAIAWNGSRECARAVSDAMTFLERASAVSVLVLDQSREAGHEPPETLEIMRHLKAHGVNAVLVGAASGALKTSDAIIAEAQRIDAQLIVAGAQSAGGLIQWLNGSVSRELLPKTPIPLLMAH